MVEPQIMSASHRQTQASKLVEQEQSTRKPHRSLNTIKDMLTYLASKKHRGSQDHDCGTMQ